MAGGVSWILVISLANRHRIALDCNENTRKGRNEPTLEPTSAGEVERGRRFFSFNHVNLCDLPTKLSRALDFSVGFIDLSV